MPQRRMFGSTLGLVGLGPMLMEEGDQVCIFRGARVPFIVRPTPKASAFELIGEAYLDGQMHGRLAKFHLPKEQIVLV